MLHRGEDNKLELPDETKDYRYMLFAASDEEIF